MVRVKICGNTDAEQVAMCVRAGADAIGVVVEYPVPVPWNLTRERARALLALAPPLVSRVVVTGGPSETVFAIARFLQPHLVQLHTDNSLAETADLTRALDPLGIGLIRALRIDIDTGTACGEVPDPIAAARALQDAGVAAVLVDARTAAMPAGTGVRVSWETAAAIRRALAIPLILAGGLTPENVQDAVAQVDPFAVDVISGVETARGVKAPELVHAFVRQAKGVPGAWSE